jgi:hypothetical protein
MTATDTLYRVRKFRSLSLYGHEASVFVLLQSYDMVSFFRECLAVGHRDDLLNGFQL